MAHIGDEVLHRNAPELDPESRGPSYVECNVCGVSESTQVIGRDAAPKTTKPGTAWHYDRIHMPTKGINNEHHLHHLVDEASGAHLVFFSEKGEELAGQRIIENLI